MSRTTTPPDQAVQVLALVKAQAAARERVSRRAIAHATAAARGFSGWYDTGDITEWAGSTAAAMETYQRSVAASTDAYLARVLTALHDRRIRPGGRVDVSGLRQGVTHAGAYGRVADTYRWQQAQWDRFARSLLSDSPPASPPDLVTPAEAAVNRATSVAQMDMQLAHQAQAQRDLTKHADAASITGYRRVIHPELSHSGSCGLCVAASTRIYHVKQLLAVHHDCACTVLPIVGSRDPGAALNRGDIDRLYHEAGGTAAAKLKATRYQVDDHAELGPLLNREGAQVRTKADVRRDTDTARRAKTPAQRAAAVRKLRGSLTPALARAQELAGEDKNRWGDFAHQLQRRVESLDAQIAA